MNTISLVNEGIMENGKMNKVTKTTKEDAKPHQEEKNALRNSRLRMAMYMVR